MSIRAKRWRLLLAVLLSVAVFGLLVRLGSWQLQRANYKDALTAQAGENATHAPSLPHELTELPRTESWHFRPVRVVGRFDPERQYLLDNRTFDGRAGYHVLSVFNYADQHLLVNRGWLPVGADRRVLPDVSVDAQEVSLTGRLAAPPGSGLLLGDSGYEHGAWPKVVQRVELQTMAAQLGFPLLSAVLLLDPQHRACFRCRWAAARGISAQRHRGYALQWFALAAALIVLLGVAGFFGVRRSAK